MSAERSRCPSGTLAITSTASRAATLATRTERSGVRRPRERANHPSSTASAGWRYRTSSNTDRCAGRPSQALGFLTWASGGPGNESTEVHAERRLCALAGASTQRGPAASARHRPGVAGPTPHHHALAIASANARDVRDKRHHAGDCYPDATASPDGRYYRARRTAAAGHREPVADISDEAFETPEASGVGGVERLRAGSRATRRNRVRRRWSCRGAPTPFRRIRRETAASGRRDGLGVQQRSQLTRPRRSLASYGAARPAAVCEKSALPAVAGEARGCGEPRRILFWPRLCGGRWVAVV
jgi:hypothetical protein